MASAIGAAWFIREDRLISPADGLGYALGIVGTTLMVLLLLYPLRKRVRALRGLGSVSGWFRVHMIFGVIGPALVLLHCNFDLGSLNSRVALFSTLTVALSGLFGRYFYSRIHYGLYGKRATLETLRRDFADLTRSGTARENPTSAVRSPMADLMPVAIAQLERVETPLLEPAHGLRQVIWLAIRAAVLTRWARLRAIWSIERAIAEVARHSPLLRREQHRLVRNLRVYCGRRTALVRQYAQLALFERLFGLWHVVHFPLFLVLVLTVIVHVVAVHLY